MAAPLLVVIALLLVAACDAGAPSVAAGPDVATPTSPAPADPGALEPSEGFTVDEITFSDGGRLVRMPVLVADDAGLRSVGLMHRTELPDDAGMLFVFAATTRGAFWMKDTPLPLTIAFVGQDGSVQQLIDMDPCLADPCPRYEPDEPYRYAVEANQGFFAARGIAPGWTLELGAQLGGGS